MSGRATPWTTAVLVALCTGLGLAVTLELSGGLSLAPEVTAAAPAPSQPEWSPEPLAFEPPSAERLDDITARPLFSPSRRPFVAAKGEEPVAVARSLPALQLIGVLVTEQQRAALMQPEGAAEPSWVREGASMAGWRVEAIEQNRVHLRANDRVTTVELRPDTAFPARSRPKPRKPRTDEGREAANNQNDDPGASDESEADLQEQRGDEENKGDDR
jgi:hypothetical protein